MSTYATGTEAPLERFPLSNRPTLVITKQLQEKIALLHERVGNKEWSGELITSEKGKITDLDDWTVTAEDMFLVDIGSGAFTEYEVGRAGFKAADICDLYDAHPGLETGELKNHHIHTHHSMGAFMSGTDWSQMNDRGKIANYFIMLVVDTVNPGSRLNHTGWVAHVGFPATLEQVVKSRVEKSDLKIKFANNEDGYPALDMGLGEGEKVVEKEENKVKRIMCIMECNVVKEEMDVRQPDPFWKRFNHVAQAIAEPRTTYPTPTQYPGVGGYAGKQNTTTGNVPTVGASKPLSKKEQKRLRKEQEAGKQHIMSMTEKDWIAYQTEENGRKPYTFDKSTAKALLNASVDYGFIDKSRWNDKDPIHAMLQNYQKNSHTVFQEWIDGFVVEMRTWADSNFPDHTDEEYLELVGEVYKYVQGFSYQFWATLLAPELKEELTLYTDLCLEGYAAEDADKRALAGNTSPILNQQGLPFPVQQTGPSYGGVHRSYPDAMDDEWGN